jgi:hypothetical protein
MISILFLLFLSKNVLSSYNGHLYGIDKSSLTASFVEIENNSSNYNRLLSLGRATFPGPSNAMKSFNNDNYIVTYNTYDYYAVPHYFILTIYLKNKFTFDCIFFSNIRLY